MKTRTRKPVIVIQLPSVKLPARDRVARASRVAGLIALTAASAIVTKESRARSELAPLAQVETLSDTSSTDVLSQTDAHTHAHSGGSLAGGLLASLLPSLPVEVQADGSAEGESAADASDDQPWLNDPSVRYFNGRPVRPARTLNMLVTAYSPDWRSCDDSDDGITASIHSVATNDGCLVAADTRILPMGSMISVPGYDQDRIVPVLDRGGAIKGHRLDVLYPTHNQAKKWGARRLKITVWEYADGQPADDYRKLRGTRRNWR